LIYCLSASEVDIAWPDLLPHLQRFASLTGAISPEQIRKAAKKSLQQVWCYGVPIETVAVPEILDTPRGPICQVAAYVGSLEGMDELLIGSADWAKTLGCVAMRVSGRKGWLKRGFKQTGIVAEREL